MLPSLNKVNFYIPNTEGNVVVFMVFLSVSLNLFFALVKLH